jgi:hypothetical protein
VGVATQASCSSSHGCGAASGWATLPGAQTWCWPSSKPSGAAARLRERQLPAEGGQVLGVAGLHEGVAPRAAEGGAQVAPHVRRLGVHLQRPDVVPARLASVRAGRVVQRWSDSLATGCPGDDPSSTRGKRPGCSPAVETLTQRAPSSAARGPMRHRREWRCLHMGSRHTC